MSDTATAPVIKDPNWGKADFEEGFNRGEETITSVRLQRPQGGALRGLSTLDVIRQDFNAIVKLAPRITHPTMTEADVVALSPADLLTLGSEIGSFFMTTKAKLESGLQA